MTTLIAPDITITEHGAKKPVMDPEQSLTTNTATTAYTFTLP